jgi:hypothetical protein
MPKAKLWQAVVLSLDVSPDDEQPMFDWIFGDSQGHTAAESDFLCECRRRTKVARASVSIDEGPLYPISFPNSRVDDPDTEINLEQFGAWAHAKGWELPSRFPGVGAEPFAAATARWPWGDHETQLLRHLAAAGKQWWSTFDPDDMATAPKSKDVENWLIERGVAKRTAEVMATMLRAEGVPTGPRG